MRNAWLGRVCILGSPPFLVYWMHHSASEWNRVLIHNIASFGLDELLVQSVAIAMEGELYERPGPGPDDLEAAGPEERRDLRGAQRGGPTAGHRAAASALEEASGAVRG